MESAIRRVLGKDCDLFGRELYAHDVNWIVWDIPSAAFRAKERIRSRHTEQRAAVTPINSDSVHIVFDEPQRATAKGQAVVLYQDDIVLGGGIIQ